MKILRHVWLFVVFHDRISGGWNHFSSGSTRRPVERLSDHLQSQSLLLTLWVVLEAVIQLTLRVLIWFIVCE